MKKRKCAAGGVVVGPRSMQDQLIAIRPKFADGGRVDAAEEAMRRMASKYGTAVPPPTPQAAVVHQTAPGPVVAQPTDRGLSSLPGQIQKRTDELNRLMDYDKPKPRGMAAGGIPGIDEPISLAGPAPFRQDIGAGVGATSLQSGNLSGLPAAAGMTPQSQGFLGAADYSTGPKQGGFVSGDGTPRGVDQGQSPSTSREYAPGLSAARGISDTIAMNKAMTGLSMVDRAALSNPTNQPYMADGRLAQNGRTFVTPGSAAESSMLNAQTSALESLQKNLMAPLKLGSSANPNASGGFAATALQRAALPDATQAQPMPAMPANPMDSPSRRSRGRQMYADGGMVRFAGKGGPREDKIPVKVAGEEVSVSDGESAVILPAKTAANPQAVQAIGQVIQQSNDGRAPDMGGVQSGGKYELGTVRLVPSDAELMRGLQETEIARAADAQARQVAQRVFPTLPGQVELRDKAIQANNPQSSGAYKAELSTRDAMTARAAESANMQAAIDGAKSQPAINPKALPAQPIYQPNWTAGKAPVLEGVVETADEVRAKSATPPRQAIGAPQPGTAVTPRTVDWTPGGNPPAGGPVQARSVDWTYGQSSGQAQQPGMAAQAARTTPQISGPQEAIQADPRTMSRTAAAARSRGAMSPEAAAFEAARTAEPAAAASRPVGMAQQAIGKVGKYLAPVAKFATAADIAANAYNSGRDGGAIQLAPSEQQTGDYANQGGLGRFASAAKHGLTAGMLNVGDAAAGVIDGAAGLPNLILPKNAQIPSVQQIYRQQAQDTFRPGGVGGEHGTVTLREDQRQADPPQAAVQKLGMAAQAIGAPDPRIAETTGNAKGAVYDQATGRLAFIDKGMDVTKQKIADGTGLVQQSGTGKTILFTGMSPNQYTAADGTQNARWEQTQAYLDAQQRLQADKMRFAEIDATRQGMNPVQAIAATQGMAQAAQRAPLDRAVVQQQIDAGKVAAQNAKDLQDLYAAHKAATSANEQERIAEQIRVRVGKDKAEEFAHAAGGTTFNQTTMGVEKTPDVIYSKRTGKPVSSPAVASKAFSKSDVDAAIRAGASKEAVAARIKSMGMNPKDYGL